MFFPPPRRFDFSPVQIGTRFSVLSPLGNKRAEKRQKNGIINKEYMLNGTSRKNDHLFAVRLFTARDIRSRTFQKRMQAAHRGRQRTAAQSLLPFGRKRCDSGDRSRSHRCSAQKLPFSFSLSVTHLHIRFMIFIKACRLLPDRRQISQLRRFFPRAAHSVQTPSSAAAVNQSARSG